MVGFKDTLGVEAILEPEILPPDTGFCDRELRESFCIGASAVAAPREECRLLLIDFASPRVYIDGFGDLMGS